MKRTRKILMIVAAALFAAGVLICGVTLFRVNFDFTKLSNVPQGEKVEKTVEVGSIRTIEVLTSFDNVYLEESPDTSIHFIYWDREEGTYSVEESSEKITMQWEGKARPWYKHVATLDFNFEDNTVRVQLPRSYKGGLSVEGDTDNVEARGIGLSQLVVTVNTGNVKCTSLEAEKLQLKTGSGWVEVKDCVGIEDASLETDTGDITAESFSAEGSVSCQTGTGRLTAANIRGDTVTLTASTGDIRLIDLDAQSALLHTNTGNIKGSTLGEQKEFTVRSSSGTGSNNLPEVWDGGKRILDVSTSTGSIEIAFAGDSQK